MTKYINITGAVALTALASTAQAASLSIEGPDYVSPGDSFSIDLVGDFPDGFLAGNSLINYDPSLVSITSVALTLGGEDPAFSCGDGTTNPACTSIPGTESVAWFNFFGFGAVAPGTVMATLTFTTNAPGIAVFSLADDLVLGGWVDSDFALFSPDYSGTTVVCPLTICPGDDPDPVPDIPVPATVWLFGSGLLGLIGVARRKT